MRQNPLLLKEGLRFDRTKTPTSPENLRGGAIFPKAPCQQTRTAAKTDHRRNGSPQRRTARRSFPNSEVFGLQSKVPTTNSASPEHLRGGAISPKAPCLRTRTAAKTDHRRNGSPQRRTARRSFPTSETHPTKSGSPSLTNLPQSSGRPDGS